MKWLLLLLLFNLSVYAQDISINEQDIDGDGANEIIAQNKLIKVIVSPNRGGRIFGYGFISDKNFDLIHKFWGVASDHPDVNDWGIYREKEYSYQIEKNDLGDVLIKLTLKDDSLPFKVKKIIKIKKDDSTLTILHKFLRKGESKKNIESAVAGFFLIEEDSSPWVVYVPFKKDVIPMGGKNSDEKIEIPFLSEINAYHKFKSKDLISNDFIFYNPNYDRSFVIKCENSNVNKLATGIDNNYGYISYEFHFMDDWGKGDFKSYVYTINIIKGCPIEKMQKLVNEYKLLIPEISFEYKGKKPIIEGSFLQAWEPVCNWSEEEWANELKIMKDVGINLIIIQATGMNNIAFYPSKYLPMVGNNYIEKVIRQAEKLGMKVMMGLYCDNTWWHADESKVYLPKEAIRNKKIALEIYELFGKYSSFDGWYIPHEISDAVFRSDELRDKLAAFISDISSYCKNLTPGKKVAIAPYYAMQMTIPQYKQWWDKFLQRANIDIVALQDGVGVHGEKRIKKIPSFFSAVKEACEKNKVEFWSDLEVFEQIKAEPFEARPANIERIKKQLIVTAPYVSKFVIFAFNDYMSPQKNIKNKSLYEAYKKYYEAK